MTTGSEELRMHAHYYLFERPDAVGVDRILSGDTSPVDWIQSVANDAIAHLTALDAKEANHDHQ